MPDAKPDAVLFPAALKRGATSAARLQHIQTTLGPRLGGDRHTELGPDHGGRIHSRDVGGGWYLATLDPADTLNFPHDHDRAGMPRYRWEEQPDGTRHGWLIPEDETPAPEAP
jgi:hypothetical protein